MPKKQESGIAWPGIGQEEIEVHHLNPTLSFQIKAQTQ